MKGLVSMKITLSLNGDISINDDHKKKIKRNKGKSCLLFPDNYTVIDIETTGLDSRYNSIIEVAAIRVRNNNIASTFSSLVKPDQYYVLDKSEFDSDYLDCTDFLLDDENNGFYYIDSFITELTGITNKMLFDSPEPKAVLNDFLKFLGDDLLIGHNVNFDINFLYDEFKKLYGKELSNNFVDTLRLSRFLHKDLLHHRLCDMSAFYNIDYSNQHRSLADCFITNSLLDHLKDTALKEYGNIESFLSTLKRKTHNSIDLKQITPENNNFDITHPLYNKVCVFTGALERMIRKEAMQIVVNSGGKIGNTVTKKTNYLILGNNTYCTLIKDGKSNKQKKAEKLKLDGQDIEILSEDVFYDMINFR